MTALLLPASEWAPAIDTAEYQGIIDHAAVKMSGVEVAIVKVHNTTVPDPMGARNVAGFESVDVGLAGYWYAHTYLDRAPITQAFNDLAWAEKLSPGALFHMADVEGGENSPLATTWGIFTATARDWWNDYVRALPDEVWLYGGQWYLGQLDQALVARHNVITAAYPRQGANPAPGQWADFDLALPRPQWPSKFPYAGTQFTSSGTVPGINALCDLNILRRSSLPASFTYKGDAMPTPAKICRERSKPTFYWSDGIGIIYRELADADLPWAKYAQTINGGDTEIHIVDDGKLGLLGVLVKP